MRPLGNGSILTTFHSEEVGSVVSSASANGAGDRIAAPSPRPELDGTAEHVVVLGCGGFIGSHLLDRLLRDSRVRVEGWDTCVDKIRPHLADPRLELHLESIADDGAHASLERAIRRADVVVNLASICRPSEYNTRPLRVIRSNFTDACEVVEMCAREHTWLVHFSTSEVYGRTLASYVSPGRYDDVALFELDEDSTPLVMGPVQNQRWTYATAKQLLERVIFANAQEESLPFTIVRPFNFFGPRMDFIPGIDGSGLPRMLASFMGSLLRGEPIRVVDGGGARRTILSIHDAVDAVILMLTHRPSAENQIFNIGNRANEVTILELADLMRRTYAEITGKRAYRRHAIEFVTGIELYGEGYEDCDRRMPRLDKATTRLGWEPRVPLREALRETMTYYHEHYDVERHVNHADMVA
ncbi:MAG TPA: NAD-dependent epimerase/dehydratase family protein [Gaiellaceae bacterium]|nr:NAD-dependent epimerase/dehydratase family protein [Gaiellaceae bacterium]